MLLVHDVETSGLPLFTEPSDHPRQPFLVQMGLLVLDDDMREVGSLSLLAQPPHGRAIEPEAQAAHGVDTETARRFGLPAHVLVEVYCSLRAEAKMLIGHNISFDQRIMRIEMMRLGRVREQVEAIEGASPTFCTMRTATPLCKMEPTGRMKAAGRAGQFKSPKLEEAVRILLGREMEGAHDALADCRAAADLYRFLNA